jgi:drug/metabolite transporter (DMT)-like permease
MQEASRIHASSNPPRAIAGVSGVDVAQLVLLAGLWGGSFVFMRVAAPAFGPVPLVALRVAVAAFILAPFLRLPDWRHMAPRLAWLGVVNSAVPFALFAHAALHLPAGFSAILNATAALWAVAIGWGLFGRAVDGRALAGVVAGVVGVMCMVGPQLVWSHQVDDGTAVAVAAAVAGTVCYGYAAHYSRQHLSGVPSRSIAGGSLRPAAVVLAFPGLWLWPEARPSSPAVACAVALGALSTAWAYLLYFDLIQRIGAARAMTVTLMVPAFGVLLGPFLLGEALSFSTVIGGALVLLGCVLALGGRSK